MRTFRLVFLMVLFLGYFSVSAQTKFKEVKAGHVFFISLPDYMSKTTGLNSSATIQFQNAGGEAAGFVIEDSKEDLKLAEMSFASIDAFYDDFIKDFLVDQEKRKISKPVSKKVGEISFMEVDASYHDKEANMDIYYLVGIVETKTTYYKLLCWSSVADKDKFKADFQKILYSLRD